jgi:AcrR family transcriptional regulator
MARRRLQNPDISRERILEAAAELFSQKGYAGTGVDELAARAEIAKTAIYYHFGSKEGLVTAVLDRAATAWIEGIREAASQAGDPLARLDRALTGMRTMVEEKPWIMKLLQLLALEVAEHKPDVRATLQSIVRRARDAITDGMHDALGLEVPDAQGVASVILALLDGLALGLHLDPDLVSLDQAFEEMRRITLFMVISRLNPELLGALEASPMLRPER